MFEMTLIITEITPWNIIMAGDSAITFPTVTPMNTWGERAFFGLKKVLPIVKLQAGTSYWGWTKMPPHTDEAPWMDDWLAHFLQSNLSNYDSIHDLALLLEKELRNIVPRLFNEKGEENLLLRGGIHLAGYMEYKDEPVPCFWHIHNGISESLPDKKLDPSLVNANFDLPPDKVLKYNKSAVINNGDYEAFTRFFRVYFQKYQKELRDEMKMTIPIHIFRNEFWRAQIKFIASLYSIALDTSKILVTPIPKSIGGEVTTLSITPNGFLEYETR